tara:strand:- start:42 stop:200 length:159 start_codon:yes stop_codon:yes gene_type:complete
MRLSRYNGYLFLSTKADIVTVLFEIRFGKNTKNPKPCHIIYRLTEAALNLLI